MHTITINTALPDNEALALAQFCKRLAFNGAFDCAVDEEEAYAMLSALDKIRTALAEQGFAPR